MSIKIQICAYLVLQAHGKSYFIKLNILREFLLNTIQYIIDPENEYTEIGKFLGGTIITLSPSSDNFLNIFAIN